MFYNTGIATYVWLLSNRKVSERQGKVQLIDASAFWEPMRRSLGDKRREIPPQEAREILKIHRDYRDGDTRAVTGDGNQAETVVSRVFSTSYFGFRRITVERPLRLNFQASPERIERFKEEKGFHNLAKSRKRGQAAAEEEAQGQELQKALIDLLGGLPDAKIRNRRDFEEMLEEAVKNAGLKLTVPVRKAVLAALSERDESAVICRKRDGSPEPDPELRDEERVPLAEDVYAFFEREVAPHVAGRLDRRVQARRQGWRSRRRRLRNQFQSLLLPATRRRARWGRSRPTFGRSKRRSCGCWERSRLRHSLRDSCL